jgi:hypothetical protein
MQMETYGSKIGSGAFLQLSVFAVRRLNSKFESRSLSAFGGHETNLNVPMLEICLGLGVVGNAIQSRFAAKNAARAVL